jgi:hypothetical protein
MGSKWLLALIICLLLGSLAFAALIASQAVVLSVDASSDESPFDEFGKRRDAVPDSSGLKPTLAPCVPASDGTEVLTSAAFGGYWAAVTGSWTDDTKQMHVSYGLIEQSEGIKYPQGNVSLDLMRAPVERVSDGSPVYAAYPLYKPKLLKLYGRRSGGTDADPKLDVEMSVVGLNSDGSEVVFYLAKLGTYGSNQLNFAPVMEQVRYTLPDDCTAAGFVCAVGMTDFVTDSSDEDGLLAGVALYRDDLETSEQYRIRLCLVLKSDSAAQPRSFNLLRNAGDTNGEVFENLNGEDASANRTDKDDTVDTIRFSLFGIWDVDRVQMESQTLPALIRFGIGKTIVSGVDITIEDGDDMRFVVRAASLGWASPTTLSSATIQHNTTNFATSCGWTMARSAAKAAVAFGIFVANLDADTVTFLAGSFEVDNPTFDQPNAIRITSLSSELVKPGDGADLNSSTWTLGVGSSGRRVREPNDPIVYPMGVFRKTRDAQPIFVSVVSPDSVRLSSPADLRTFARMSEGSAAWGDGERSKGMSVALAGAAEQLVTGGVRFQVAWVR